MSLENTSVEGIEGIFKFFSDELSDNMSSLDKMIVEHQEYLDKMNKMYKDMSQASIMLGMFCESLIKECKRIRHSGPVEIQTPPPAQNVVEYPRASKGCRVDVAPGTIKLIEEYASKGILITKICKALERDHRIRLSYNVVRRIVRGIRTPHTRKVKFNRHIKSLPVEPINCEVQAEPVAQEQNSCVVEPIVDNTPVENDVIPAIPAIDIFMLDNPSISCRRRDINFLTKRGCESYVFGWTEKLKVKNKVEKAKDRLTYCARCDNNPLKKEKSGGDGKANNN